MYRRYSSVAPGQLVRRNIAIQISTCMKNLFVLFFVAFGLTSHAQIVSGIYMGKLENDSTKKTHSYELALSEYRGKISGYSYTTFVSNDTFYYSIKKIRATRKDGQLIIEDDKMIVNNFPQSRARKVHPVHYIQLTNEDTLRQMNGHWETNRTKQYYSIGGNLELRLDNDSSRSALLTHLKELDLIANTNSNNNTASASQTPEREKKKPSATSPSTPSAAVTAAVPARLNWDQRASKMAETVEAIGDSLVLSFYDNGVVDGDSISVFANGEQIVSNARLTTTAVKKKIAFGNAETLTLHLVAENLGGIPPNTGLLTITDGQNTYQINFRADLTTNSEIRIKRKK